MLKFVLISIMSVTTYLVRAVPFTLMRKKVSSPFLKSILYYMPYAILSAMTIPAVFYSSEKLFPSLVGFIAAVVTAVLGMSLAGVALSAAGVSLIIWLIQNTV